MKKKYELDNTIFVELIPKPNFSAYAVDVEDPLDLNWKESDVVRRLGFNNELLEVIKKTIKQVSKSQPIPSSEPSTRNAQPLPAEIQKALPGVE